MISTTAMNSDPNLDQPDQASRDDPDRVNKLTTNLVVQRIWIDSVANNEIS